MLHISFPRYSKQRKSCRWTVLLTLCMCLLPFGGILPNAFGAATQIEAVTGSVEGKSVTIRIKGSTPPTYTVYELFKPARIIVDIADSDLAPSLQAQLPESEQISFSTRKVTDVTPPLTRLEFTMDQSHPFKSVLETNEIVLTITKQSTPPAAMQEDEEQNGATAIREIKVLTTPEQTKVQLLADGKVSNYKHDVLDRQGASPPRLFIDLNNVTGDTLLQEQMVGTALSKIRVAKRGSGLRIVMDSSSNTLFQYTIQKIPNGLEVVIDEPKGADQLSSLINQKKTIESQLPGEIDPLEKQLSPQATEQKMQDAFNFSGYNKERITVDFYKIDLHNVFRLLREISGVNIVVDEAVTGSLTLALDNVPWDFALDIILNLKDLQKEERFNTLVIVPKDKGFNWPNQAENNLSFEADVEVVEEEALLIRQQKALSKEVVAAKAEIGKGRQFEKRGDYETAIKLYEKALKLWPENGKLANRIASIYLVQLRQNAKAVFYAKKSLAVDPENTSAALNAAIALANMQEKQQAMEFFDRSVSTEKPSREALISYAAFSEAQEEYDGALKILKKHDELYGESLNSMIAAARIYDRKGDAELATSKYKAILLSGLRIPPDLTSYIKGRIALKQSM